MYPTIDELKTITDEQTAGKIARLFDLDRTDLEDLALQELDSVALSMQSGKG